MKKPRFTKAIVRIPCENMVKGLTGAGLGVPDHRKALVQHGKYIDALEQCGLEVVVLDADEGFPDSTFVEDTALMTSACAIVTIPGAASRKGETVSVREALKRHYERIESIVDPGTVDAGDIMMVGTRFYVGMSDRTNPEGARQTVEILKKHGLEGSIVPVEKALHLKTGVSYLENNTLAASSDFINHSAFEQFRLLPIEDEESYAANCVWINGTVLVPEGYPNAKKTIESAGYATVEVDVSEFMKLDGGLSCLSLRF